MYKKCTENVQKVYKKIVQKVLKNMYKKCTKGEQIFFIRPTKSGQKVYKKYRKVNKQCKKAVTKYKNM